MTIKQQGGVFGRNPSYNDIDANILNVDNIKLDGNTISSTNTNGNLNLTTDGTGSTIIGNTEQASYTAAKFLKKFNGTVAVQFDGGGANPYADLFMNESEHLSLRLDPNNALADQIFSISHNGSNFVQFFGSNGEVKLNTGNLVIGTSGSGIDFSATSGTGTSELFDDYEEGTWTPTIVGSSTEGDFVYTTQSGFYTKVGRNVTLTGRASISSVNTGATGNTLIGNLPFLTSTTTDIVGTLRLDSVNYGSVDYLVLGPRATNNNQLWMLSNTSNSGVGFINAGSFIANSVAVFALTFMTES